MDYRSRTSLLGVVAVLATSLTCAQGLLQSTEPGGIEPQAAGCTYEFGSGDFRWCLSSTGNLQRLTSPEGTEHVAVGFVVEGYAICASHVDQAEYYDRGGLPGVGFGPPSVLAGPTSRGITISRTTLDGLFRLDQKWSADPGERELTVEMTLHNFGSRDSGSDESFLARFVDVDANGSTSGDTYGHSTSGTWIRESDAVSVVELGVRQYSPGRTRVGPGDPYLTLYSDYSGLEVACLPPEAMFDSPRRGADVAAAVLFPLVHFEPGDRATARLMYRVQ